MERVVKEVVSFKAVDGRLFSSEEECRKHEAEMTRFVYYSCRFPYSGDKSKTGWQYGYSVSSSHTVFDPPGFLNPGGERTVWDSNDVVLGVALGTYDTVLAHALTNETFWKKRESAFIWPIHVYDLRDRD